jgi:hypothetical protein
VAGRAWQAGQILGEPGGAGWALAGRGPGRVVTRWCGAGRVSLARPSWDDPGDRMAGMAGLAVQARAGLGSGPGWERLRLQPSPTPKINQTMQVIRRQSPGLQGTLSPLRPAPWIGGGQGLLQTFPAATAVAAFSQVLGQADSELGQADSEFRAGRLGVRGPPGRPAGLGPGN